VECDDESQIEMRGRGFLRHVYVRGVGKPGRQVALHERLDLLAEGYGRGACFDIWICAAGVCLAVGCSRQDGVIDCIRCFWAPVH
jgi:hypothetical protein